MNQDADHLRLLSIFHYIVAGIIALFGCFPLVHVAFGTAMLVQPDLFGTGSGGPPPQLMGLMFLGVGLFISGLFWATAAGLAGAGYFLSRRRHYLFCLVVAGVACLIMPFGTVLGVFTIIVLQRPAVKQLFDLMPPL